MAQTTLPKLPSIRKQQQKQSGLDLIMEVGIKANENLSSLGSEDVMQQTSSKVPDAEDNICNFLEETNVWKSPIFIFSSIFDI